MEQVYLDHIRKVGQALDPLVGEKAVGHFGLVEGYGHKEGVLCGPQAKGYCLTIDVYRGKHFQGGKVAVYIDAFACSPEIPNWEEEGPGDGEMPQITCGDDDHQMTARDENTEAVGCQGDHGRGGADQHATPSWGTPEGAASLGHRDSRSDGLEALHQPRNRATHCRPLSEQVPP